MSPSNTGRTVRTAAIVAVGALILSACGNGAEADNDEVRQVSVGMMPIATSVALEYGIQEGIFEDHDIEVETASQASGAAMLPAVSTEQVDFGVGNPLSVAIAVDEGMDMRIVSGFSNAIEDGDDIAGTVVRDDSGIEEYQDLGGRSTAVVSLQTFGDLTLRHVAQDEGADPQELDFTEIQFGEMAAQLELENIDAAFLTEPFLSQALEDEENRLLGYNVQDSIPGMPTLVTFTSGTLAEEDPELVSDFQEAMTEALEAALANEAEVRELLPDFIDMPSEAAETVRMDEWDGSIKEDELTRLYEVAAEHEYISEAVDPSELSVD